MGRIIFGAMCITCLALLWLATNNIFEKQQPVLVLTESREEIGKSIPMNNPENYCMVSAVTKEGDTVTAVCRKSILEGYSKPFKAALFPSKTEGLYKIKEF